MKMLGLVIAGLVFSLCGCAMEVADSEDTATSEDAVGDRQCTGQKDGTSCHVCDLAGVCMAQTCKQVQQGAPYCR